MTRTVLTLTTSPQRMQHLPLVLDALFNQLSSPYAVYLNLPERYRNRDAYIIPDWLGDALQVTLLHRVDDLGPVMKILPVLEVETDSDTLLTDTRQPCVLPRFARLRGLRLPAAAFRHRTPAP